MVFAFVTVSAVLGSSTVRGLPTLCIGLLLGLVGIARIDRRFDRGAVCLAYVAPAT
ncbi:MAG: hypothetical protein ABJA83_02800 [Burkholderiaceae bacterium]